MPLELTSPAFQHKGEIPKVHTCDDANSAPPLRWSDVPRDAKSLALIVDDPDAPDPDAPTHTFVHWVLHDIPPSTTTLDGGDAPLPAGTRIGTNDRKRSGYTGPCPPIGRHRYFFKLYALDTELGDLGAPTKDTLERAMKGHVLEHTELVGTYQRA
jgi:Raf kinase inhibitor-like YbhB/YbcL family protein